MCEVFFAIISLVLALYVLSPLFTCEALLLNSIFRSQIKIALRFILFAHSIWTMEFFFLTQNNTVEIILLIVLLVTLVAIWSHDLYSWIGRIRRVFSTGSKRISDIPHIIQKTESSIVESINIDSENENIKNINMSPLSSTENTETMTEKTKINIPNIEKLAWLISSVRTLIARGMPAEARTLIVEGLSLDRHHRELNLFLWQIYEWDGQYEKSEYIYKDLAELHPDDIEILEKLANVLIVEKKYTIASEIYKKILVSTGNTETTLYMLTHISNTLENRESTLKYAKQYILQWPKNPEIISLLANTQVALWLRRDAIETYKNLKNLTPYSSEITEILQKLLIEEELANNFEVKG